MVDFGSRNLHLRFLQALEDAVDAIFLDRHLQCSARAMLHCPLRNARHLLALPDKVGVGHLSNPLFQHNPWARVVPQVSIRTASGILSMNLQPPLLLPRVLAD
jgi:hypothetical protein